MNLSYQILIGLFLGLLLGVFISLDLVPALSIIPVLIKPIGVLWINAIRMIVIPLLLALLITAVAGDKNNNQVTKVGGKAILIFIVMVIINSLYTFLVAPFFMFLMPIDSELADAIVSQHSAVSVTEIPPFEQWLTAIIPTNPFAAAASGSILPLMVFTGLFALSLRAIQDHNRQVIVDFFEGIKQAMFVLIGWIMKVAPLGVFALIVPLTASLGLATLQILGAFITIACLLIVIMIVLLYIFVVVFCRISFKKLINAMTPLQIIGFSTRSSLAALPATFTVTEKLGVSSAISGVVLPFAVTMFKWASPIARITGTYFIAALYGIDLTVLEMLIIALSIGLLSFYSPGIPSGGLLIMSPVYLSLGLPLEGIGILIAVDLIIDMFITAANVSANVAVALLVSRFGLLQSEGKKK